MKTSEATRKVLERYPFVLECLKRGIINYSALARAIYDEVVEETGERVELDSIKMAIIRTAEKLRKTEKHIERQIRDLIAKSTLELKEDIAVITVKHYPLDRVSLVTKKYGFRFFQLTQGIGTTTIAFDQRNLEEVIKEIGRDNIVSVIKDQSAIILVSPEKIIDTPGVIAYVTGILTRFGINITQIISCYTDTVFVIDKKLSTRAYEVLKKLISSLREEK